MKAKSEPFSKTEWILLITAVALAVFLVTSVLKDSTAQTPITIITDAPQTTHTQSYELPSRAASADGASASESVEETTEQIFIINKSSKKFHSPDCARAASMKEENREQVSGKTAEDLASQGYSPCGSCVGKNEKSTERDMGQ